MRRMRAYPNFYSRPSARGDSVFKRFGQIIVTISTHAPLRGATITAILRACNAFDFYSRPSARGDLSIQSVLLSSGRFLLTPLCEGRPMPMLSAIRTAKFLLTPLCEGRPGLLGFFARPYCFYSRPSARGDRAERCPPPAGFLFLLTPLCEGRQNDAVLSRSMSSFLLTPLCEGRPGASAKALDYLNAVSTHAPLRGATEKSMTVFPRDESFYSRPSARGDPGIKWRAAQESVSTHAPLRGAT